MGFRYPRHALRMAGYNRPLYVVIGVSVVAGGLGACLAPSGWMVTVCAVWALAAAWFGLSSFGAFYWLFDRSRLLDGHWVSTWVEAPRRWVQISVFLEETTLPLRHVWEADGHDIDLFDPDVMTESAVNRARGDTEAHVPLRGTPEALPIDDDGTDLTVVTLVAHELRAPEQRASFFHELARVTSPSGQVLLIEHTRNLAALLAYGPGWWHFLPEQEWTERSVEAGFEIVKKDYITPFVVVFLLRPMDR